MNLAFLLHIYQPPIQESRLVKEITESSYLPLIKSIKSNQNIKMTFNIPLSLTYLLHANGFDQLLGDIKGLYEAERIELTSTGAYHPVLTKIPPHIADKEIILNEYGLGYYFGKDKGFEGEEALLIKNVNGFFPPEMAVNQNLLKLLDGMGYSWVMVDETAIPGHHEGEDYHPVYNFKELELKVVCRHKGLSDFISFKRDTNIDDLIDVVLELRQEGRDLVVALDGEFFGHHFDEGIYLFESLTSSLVDLGVELTTVSELVEKSEEVQINEVMESTWGTNAEKMASGNIYTLWETPGNQMHIILWELLHKVAGTLPDSKEKKLANDLQDYTTFPVWDMDELNKIEDVEIKNRIYTDILLLQSMNSDQFWWASNVEVGGKQMFHPGYIQRSLELYKQYATVSQNEELSIYIDQKAQEIAALL